MNKPPEPSDHIEREPANWFVFPIVAAILIAIFVTYRFGCSTN